jgi:uncharacterized protein (TIRG00374 family)
VAWYDWIVILLATVAFYLTDYTRLQLLLRILKARLGFFRGLKVIFVSNFASVLTPTAELHVPAAVLALSDAGVPSDRATAAIAFKTAIGIIWVCVTSVIMLLVYDHIHLPKMFSEHLYFVVIPVGAILLFYSLSILFRHRIAAWAKKQQHQPLSYWKKKLYSWLSRSVSDVSVLGTSLCVEHFLAHAMSILYIGLYAFIGFWLCHALGIDLEPLTALTIFSTSLMVDYVAPVPGSIGVTEFITAYMINPQLKPESVFVAIVLRICCKYIVIFPGAVLLLDLLRHRGLEALRGAPASRSARAAG